MRIHLKLSSNKEKVPYNYQSVLTGKFHKWLGTNDFHDRISLYSFSWLRKAKGAKHGLNFPSGSTWFISSHDDDVIKKIIDGVRQDSHLAWGMLVQDIIIQETPSFGEEALFNVGSPVFIKRWKNDRAEFIYYYHDASESCLTDTLKHKLREAKMSEEGVSVEFDKNYKNPKTKVITFKDVKNKGSVCPVIVRGSSEQISFAWNVGVGNLTGIGFGSLI